MGFADSKNFVKVLAGDTAPIDRKGMPLTTAEAIQAFRDSVTAILLDEDDFIDWGSVEKAIAASRNAAESLDAIRDGNAIDPKRLADALGQNPRIYDIALSLIAFNASGSQVSKWGLAASVPRPYGQRLHLARQLLHIGLGKLLEQASSVVDLLTVAEVHKDSLRRRFRSGDQFGTRARRIVREAIAAASAELETPASLQTESLSDPSLRRSLDFVVQIGGRSVLGIATVYQNQSGGRQQRDLSITYPFLQEKLNEYGMALVLVADGHGMIEASDRTLEELFEKVRHPMTLKQARDGALKNAIVEEANRPVPESLDEAAISRLIAGALTDRKSISTDELPLAEGPARLALARYIEANPKLALTLSTTGQKLGWTHPEIVQEARKIGTHFNGQRALRLLAHLLETDVDDFLADDGLLYTKLDTLDAPPFTASLLAAALGPGLTQEAQRTICRQALELAPGSKFAVLLSSRDLTEREIDVHRQRQTVLPVNIVTIGPRFLLRLARSVEPIRVLNRAILNQSDLTKVSPFILSNATPTRMFFGRAAEAATILGTVATNSVALLGSRRIGKTSLLRRVRDSLAEANYAPFFGDCQTVKTWADFALLAKREWDVETSDSFSPQYLGQLVQALAAGSDKPVVILLDEIDQLLEWDRTNREGSVPEAFFRACRSLSQRGDAQFVFSGERVIAQRVWDPESPHWNFCRPISLVQLTRAEATALLIQPLKSIGIRISDDTRFGDQAWRFTSGHPQIVQYLGDRLVRRLDSVADRTELQLEPSDVISEAETYEFAEHYLNTYWGQANPLERRISLKIATEPVRPNELLSSIRSDDPTIDDRLLQSSLRMLQLYGIIVAEEGLIRLRASWFTNAQGYFGGGEAVDPEVLN